MIITFNTNFVEEIRKKNKLTICEFCKQIGISKNTYKKFLAESTNISLNTIYKICSGIDAKLKDIINF